jgi:hypothetical protein
MVAKSLLVFTSQIGLSWVCWRTVVLRIAAKTLAVGEVRRFNSGLFFA